MSMDESTAETLLGRIRGIVDGPGAAAPRLQEVCDLLRGEVPHYDWVGIYVVEPGTRTLVLGPFAGEPTEHVRIPFGRGICGQAADRGETFVVDDVSAETNYLSCSALVRSEIVVPIERGGEVVGEIDIDSHEVAPFDEADRELLEGAATIVAPIL